MTNVVLVEQSLTDVPESDEWLSATEVDRLSAMRIAKRRSDWRLGRWTAKRAIASFLNLPQCRESLAAIRIEARADGSPVARMDLDRNPVTISISHSGGRALCAVARDAVQLGCDLELIEPRSDGFVRDYFTAEELAFLAQAPEGRRACWVTLLWSAKESALKALRLGLRADTRSVSVTLAQGTGPLDMWRALHVRHCTSQTLEGWWRLTGPYAQTTVCSPRSSEPAVPGKIDSTPV